MAAFALSLLLGSSLVVELPVYVGAAISPKAVELALAEADRLFEAGGIRLRFQLAPAERPGSASSASSRWPVT